MTVYFNKLSISTQEGEPMLMTSFEEQKGMPHLVSIFDTQYFRKWTEIPRGLSFHHKMETIIKELQSEKFGLFQAMKVRRPVTAFTGYDLVQWLRKRFDMEEQREAIHLSQLLCQYGYIYPLDLKSYSIKEDRSVEYRFQKPFYWPFSSQVSTDSIEYAIYLQKRSMRNKQKHGLEPYEQEAFDKLLKVYCDKKEFIEKQATEQVDEIKKKKRTEKIIFDQQERAFWRIHRPPPGCVKNLEEGPKKNFLPQQIIARKKTKEALRKEIAFLKKSFGRPRMKFSMVFESYKLRWEQYKEFDPFMDVSATQPSNPWMSDETMLWEINSPDVHIPTDSRMRKWAISFYELINDPRGQCEFDEYLQKEYSHENLHFWCAVENYKCCPRSRQKEEMNNIYKIYLEKGSRSEVNVDSKTLDQVHQNMRSSSESNAKARYVFEPAQEHIYVLMKKDSYPRYLRSDQFKDLMEKAKQQPLTKRRFFFGGPKKRPSTPSPKINRRHGSSSSDRDVSSDISGESSPVHVAHHSFSTGNLQDLDSHKSSRTNSREKDKPKPQIVHLETSGLSPGSVRRRSEEPTRMSVNSGINRRKSNLEVPKHYGVNVDKRKMEVTQTKSLNVPKTNSVAPWEGSQ
ncbi:regulator of G-protein signaling 6-like isoform X1 [Mytilus californianus]|uniref:regulator of G-protein signaling 6-like isoform X1 n=1 Tax=Mytilus californianus TaxID=6549 RepID=UPI0022475C5C|nr:regulator of G-protein signaling 6-like isoform X1 [Mytilus californianus]